MRCDCRWWSAQSLRACFELMVMGLDIGAARAICQWWRHTLEYACAHPPAFAALRVARVVSRAVPLFLESAFGVPAGAHRLRLVSGPHRVFGVLPSTALVEFVGAVADTAKADTRGHLFVSPPPAPPHLL